MAQAPLVLAILPHSAWPLLARPRPPTHRSARRNLLARPARLELEQYAAAPPAAEQAGSPAVPLRYVALAK
jgi:hypothetical protein